MELLKNLEGMTADEQMTAVLELQKSAMAHLEEQRQISIGKSAELVIQGLKKIKSDFEGKFDSLNYDIQSKVASLKNGEDGKDGSAGKDGPAGRDGLPGRDGKDGKDGQDGQDGQDGVSVVDARIDFDGSLVITLSTGREMNVGEVVAPDLAEKIKLVTSGGGTSQQVLDAIAALQAIIATYGTMAQQNANAVAITGGTIDNTVIGGTTPAAGTFTTLTATGQTSLGGAAGAEGLRVITTASAARYLIAQGATSSGSPALSASAGALVMSSGSGSPLALYTNAFAQEQLRLAHTASAVNFVQVTGAATGGAPTISAQGSDANAALIITSKGTSAVVIRSGNSGATQFRIDGTNPALNFFQVAGSATGFGPVLSAQGSDTNIPLVVQPKGTGALQAQQTDSTATGGNARGANAVDWQTIRNSAAQVASAQYSVVAGGANNTAGGFASSAGGGTSNFVRANYNVVSGGNSNQADGNFNNTYSAVCGGYSNLANGFLNFVGGGYANSTNNTTAATTQSATMNGTTAVTLSGSNANIKVGQLITGTSINSFPNTYVAAISGTSLTLSQAASGSSTSTLSFFTPHGVVVGGGNNQATGSYSFIGGGGDAGTAANRNVASGDWSFVGGGVQNVASGAGSVIAGGGYVGAILGNTASGTAAAVLGGISNNASALYATILGGRTHTGNGNYSTIVGAGWGNTRGLTGYTVFPASSAPITGTAGVSQAAMLVLGRQTTDATATALTSDGAAAGTTNQVILPNNSAYYFRGTVIANVTGGGNTKSWTIEGAIKRGANAASTTLVGTPTVTSSFADAGASTWVIAVTADTTNGGLAVTFTGQAATTIRCVCKLETTEVTF
jgi:hypothetical protein